MLFFTQVYAQNFQSEHSDCTNEFAFRKSGVNFLSESNIKKKIKKEKIKKRSKKYTNNLFMVATAGKTDIS